MLLTFGSEGVGVAVGLADALAVGEPVAVGAGEIFGLGEAPGECSGETGWARLVTDPVFGLAVAALATAAKGIQAAASMSMSASGAMTRSGDRPVGTRADRPRCSS